MQQLPPGEAPEPARRPQAHALSRLRLNPASLRLPIALAIAGAAGLLLSLANPPAAFGPVAFVALIPLLWLLRGSRARRGLLLGFTFGFAYFAATLYWIRLFGELAWSSLSLASAAYIGVIGLITPILWRDDRPVRSAIGVAALWTLAEYLRSLWPLGGFTWGGLGYTQVDDGFLMPLASVTGVWGISFVVAAVNGLVLMALDRAIRGREAVPGGGEGRARRILVPVALAIAALVLVMAPGLIPIPQAHGRPVDVAIVQGNGIEGRLPDPALEDRLIAFSHARLHRTLAANPPDLAVWPENSLDQDPTRLPGLGRLVTGAIRAVGSPTLVGAITDGPGGRQFNTDLLYDGGGRLVGRYEKVHLVPFGEFVPWRAVLGWISALRQIPRDLSPGHRLHLMSAGGLRFGTVICYENAFPSLDRRVIAKGAGFLVVSTNNASYLRTAASRQHLDMSRMRAAENGRWVVHAAVSGISAFIDPAGGVHSATGLFQATVDRFTIRTSTARTLYNRLGDYLPWASLGLVLLLLALRPTRRAPPVPLEGLPEEPRVLVVLPTYNERDTIEQVVEQILRAAREANVLVVDDRSPDGTAGLVRAISERDGRVRLLERPGKAGLAGAYLAGFGIALEDGYDLVVEMDADLSHSPEELPSLLSAARRFHLTVGSRYVEGGSVTNWGLLRRALSRGGNAYAGGVLGFPVADSTSGYRVFHRSLLQYAVDRGVTSEGYGFQIELAYAAWRAGFAVGESPITFREREHGHSKISRRIVVEALLRVTWWGLRDRFARLRPPAARGGKEPPEPTGTGTRPLAPTRTAP